MEKPHPLRQATPPPGVGVSFGAVVWAPGGGGVLRSEVTAVNPDLCVPPHCRKGAGSPEVTPVQPTALPGGDPDLDLRPQQVGEGMGGCGG